MIRDWADGVRGKQIFVIIFVGEDHFRVTLNMIRRKGDSS